MSLDYCLIFRHLLLFIRTILNLACRRCSSKWEPNVLNLLVLFPHYPFFPLFILNWGDCSEDVTTVFVWGGMLVLQERLTEEFVDVGFAGWGGLDKGAREPFLYYWRFNFQASFFVICILESDSGCVAPSSVSVSASAYSFFSLLSLVEGIFRSSCAFCFSLTWLTRKGFFL